jgi:hypothetical protein
MPKEKLTDVQRLYRRALRAAIRQQGGTIGVGLRDVTRGELLRAARAVNPEEAARLLGRPTAIGSRARGLRYAAMGRGARMNVTMQNMPEELRSFIQELATRAQRRARRRRRPRRTRTTQAAA